MEVSGVIAQVGSDVSGWSVGQEVCALLAGGGYAEHVAVPAGQVLPIPEGVDLVDAAGLPEVACTVWSNLVMTGSPERRPAAADARRGQRHRNPRDPGRTCVGRPGGGDRRIGREAGNLSRLGRADHHQLSRRGLRRAAARRDRRRHWRERDLRHHGRLLSGPQHRRPGRRWTARHHRHAGRGDGRTQPRQAAQQTGAGHRHHAARAAGQRPEQQGRHRRSGGGLGVADDRRRAGPADHRCPHARPTGGRRASTVGVGQGVRQGASLTT